MKYRSYNSELLIAATLLCDVFNDIIIDRRKHGLKRDYSKPITLGDIVQQKIEVPCVLGDRGIILKSLENEPGRYRLPLIIVQMKDLKTDSSRMADIHADIFYQQDERFSKLDYEDKLFRPQELSKRRGQPISISYDVTFITKYKEDLDQIISNFAVHFRPDIYLRWWHPRNKIEPLDSQLTWAHNVSIDSGIDYNPQNVHVYKGSTSFTFKSWLFFGMDATDNTIDPNLESIIKRIRLFPNRDKEHEYEKGNRYNEKGEFDLNGEYDERGHYIGNEIYTEDEDDIWAFGDIEKTNEGCINFWGLDSDQEFIGDDIEKMKKGQYMVNNVFAKNHPEIKDDPIISKIHENQLVGDFLSNYEIKDINNYKKYQAYILLNPNTIKSNGQAISKNVYFKGSFPESSYFMDPPSGDFLFGKFFIDQKNRYGRPMKREFGSSFSETSKIDLDYNIDTKDLTLSSTINDINHIVMMKSKFNSDNGFMTEFSMNSKRSLKNHEKIEFIFHREYDKNLNKISENDITEFYNIKSISELGSKFYPIFHIEYQKNKNDLLKIRSTLNGYWDSINLIEKSKDAYRLESDGSNLHNEIKNKNIDHLQFLEVKASKILYKNGYYYHVLTNRYIYIVLKINAKNEEECDIYDYGILFPLRFIDNHALIYEVTIPESKELLGLNFCLSI